LGFFSWNECSSKTTKRRKMSPEVSRVRLFFRYKRVLLETLEHLERQWGLCISSARCFEAPPTDIQDHASVQKRQAQRPQQPTSKNHNEDILRGTHGDIEVSQGESTRLSIAPSLLYCRGWPPFLLDQFISLPTLPATLMFC
jgi:hypothetical protein